jgi:hypothetical protein
MASPQPHLASPVYLPIPVEAPPLRRRVRGAHRLPLPMVTALLFAFTLAPVAIALSGG